jgi:hypothetical protein
MKRCVLELTQISTEIKRMEVVAKLAVSDPCYAPRRQQHSYTTLIGSEVLELTGYNL